MINLNKHFNLKKKVATCPGSKIKNLGKGRGLGTGKGQGPIGGLGQGLGRAYGIGKNSGRRMRNAFPELEEDD